MHPQIIYKVMIRALEKSEGDKGVERVCVCVCVCGRERREKSGRERVSEGELDLQREVVLFLFYRALLLCILALSCSFPVQDN